MSWINGSKPKPPARRLGAISMRKKSGSRFHLIGVAVVAVAAAAVFMLWRQQGTGLEEARAARVSAQEAGPRVQVIAVAQGPSERTFSLLADVRPYATATLYAKVSGYLRAIKVDKGDVVQEGQVLAEIDSAETDHQYQSAAADLENKRRLAQRNRELLARGTVAPQTAEQADTNERMASALVSQLAARRGYEVIRAPFAGTVTARFADPGALVQNAETSQTNALPLVTLSDNSKLRVGVYVAQADVPNVRVGDAVEVIDATNPDRERRAAVSRTAGMLDPTTRTLLVEIDVDNRDNFLVPGSFAYVRLHAPLKSYPRIPVSGIMVRGGQQQVAVISDDGRVQIRRIRIASTDGTIADVAEGLAAGERVATNVPDDVTDGSRVQPVVMTTAR
jgi:membrane fusion protein, multidrug efflux system